jgi:hypothetical protein
VQYTTQNIPPSRAERHNFLASVPQPLRNVLQRCLEWAEADGRLGLVVHGSLIKGGMDEFSDLDFTILSGQQMCMAEMLDSFERLIETLGHPIVRFRADHVGRSDTQIIYLAIDNWVAKLDVRIVYANTPVNLPKEACALLDPEQLTAELREYETDILDTESLFEKLCGWLWFTYSRLERGEFFAAARSIDFSREHALLPIILSRLALPQDGHRRIEIRLPDLLLQAIERTYPKSLDRYSVFLALAELHDLTISELAKSSVLGQTAILKSMKDMWRIISHAHEYYDKNNRQ